MTETEYPIATIFQLRRAIDAAAVIVTQVRFGTSEKWVRISKADARSLIKGVSNSTTPEQMEIYSGQFGSIIGSTVYLG